MVDTLFPDVSEFQPHADVSAIRRQTDVIAARVSYGTRLDKMMPARVADIRAQGFVVVLYYLFLRATQPVQDQVSTVVSVLGDLRPGESIVIDYESDNGSIPTVAQRDQAAELFEQRYNRPTVVYQNASTAQSAPTNRPVWVAAYGVKTEPAGNHLSWQYTDGQFTSAGIKPINWPGCGFCDSSIYHGSADELAAALQSRTPQDPAKPSTQEIDDMSTELTVVYPSGHKTIATKDGALLSAGTPSYGSFFSLRPDQKLDLQDGINVFALTPVNIADESAGCICWVIGKSGNVCNTNSMLSFWRATTNELALVQLFNVTMS